MTSFRGKWVLWLSVVLVLLLAGVAVWGVPYIERQQHLAELCVALLPTGYDTEWKAIGEPWDIKQLRLGDTDFKQTYVGEKGSRTLPNGTLGYSRLLAYRSGEWVLTLAVLPEGPDSNQWHLISVIVGRPHNADNPVDDAGVPLEPGIPVTDWLVVGVSDEAQLTRLLPRPTSVNPMLGDEVWWEYELKEDKHWMDVSVHFDRRGLVKGLTMFRGSLPRGEVHTFAR